jgi:methylmalonyl-CoA mutase
MSEEIPTKEFKLNPDLNLKSEFSSPTFEEWKAQVEKDLKGASYEKKLITKTYEGINLNPIYTSKDIKESPFIDSLPGSENFVRGGTTTGFGGKPWDVNQEILVADVENFNIEIREALKNGQNCVNLLLDTATKLGLDADYAPIDKVGDKGLSISAINSVKRAFDNIDLSKVPIYLDAGYNSVPILSLINAYISTTDTDIAKLNAAITADPMAHLCIYGELPVNQSIIFDMMKNALEWTKKSAPKIRTIGVNTLPYQNAGANSVQELAYAMSTLVYYLNQLLERDAEAEEVINNIQFSFGISTNYFMEIAKFRAAKVLLTNIANEYGVDTKNLKINIGAKSSSFYQTTLDPYVNLLRSTTETFSAILGGVNNITTSPFDESARTPDGFSRRIARNTQTILREESHLDQVIDPAGGSYFIESLTEEMANKAWDLFKEIENEGGIFDALSKGIVQDKISAVTDSRKKDINKRKSVIVGTNMFADVNETKLEERKIDQEKFQKKRAEYLKKFRLSGSKEKHEAVMEKLNSISNSNSSVIIDTMTEAYLIGTTIGEISSALNSSHKEKIQIDKLSKKRTSEDFEQLRKLATDYQTQNGSLPKVYLANWGSIKDYKARADFSKGFFEVGGFDVIDPKGFLSIEDIINSSVDSRAPIIVICSTDDNYSDIVPQIVNELKTQKPDIQIILAGYPKEQIEEHKKSGIDDFIFLGADAMEVLTSLYNKIGGTK